MNKTKTKTFNGYLYINWKDEKMSLRKTRKRGNNPLEICTRLKIKVNVPKVEMPEISTTLNVPKAEVIDAVEDEIDMVQEETEKNGNNGIDEDSPLNKVFVEEHEGGEDR